MIKQTYSRILVAIAFVALMLTLPAVHLNAELMDVNQTEINGLNQSQAPRLMAQATETRRSVTTTEEPQTTETRRSVTTTEAPQTTETRRSITTSSTAEAAPPQKPSCANQCRDQYARSMTECNQPHHPDYKKCGKWAQEREKECLEKCGR